MEIEKEAIGAPLGLAEDEETPSATAKDHCGVKTQPSCTDDGCNFLPIPTPPASVQSAALMVESVDYGENNTKQKCSC